MKAMRGLLGGHHIPMFVQLVFAFSLTAATVIIHGLGSLEAMIHLARLWKRKKGNQSSFASAILMLRIVSALLVLHWFEAAVWALFYLASGALPDLETAIYFSLTSYTTVGYGDVVLPGSWRLLGPFEAAVGILTFGWSTGIIVTSLTRIYADRLRPDSE